MFLVDFGMGKVSRGGSPDCGLERKKNSNSISPPLEQIIGPTIRLHCVEEEIDYLFEFILPFRV